MPVPSLATAPLGVFDSGVGGLTVLSALQRALPDERFIYLGDTARLPYGPKPQTMVRGFATEIAAELLARGVKGLVIACNTASAAALPDLAETLPVPTWGVVEPGVSAALTTAGGSGGRIGVLGTIGTIEARVYQDRLERMGAATWSRACPLFVPIVEEGVSDTAIARLVAQHYLSDRPSDLSAMILGCTHYPLLKGVLSEVLGSEVKLIDSAVAVAEVVKRDLQSLGLARPPDRLTAPGSTVRYLVSGDVGTFMHSAAILGGPEGSAEHIDVSTLGERVRAGAR